MLESHFNFFQVINIIKSFGMFCLKITCKFTLMMDFLTSNSNR